MAAVPCLACASIATSTSVPFDETLRPFAPRSSHITPYVRTADARISYERKALMATCTANFGRAGSLSWLKQRQVTRRSFPGGTGETSGDAGEAKGSDREGDDMAKAARHEAAAGGPSPAEPTPSWDDEEGLAEGVIPSSPEKLLKQISSETYTIKRQIQQALETSAFDVVEKNPWRGSQKSVFVLANGTDRLFTMKTRRQRSEVSQELDRLFPSRSNRWSTTSTRGLPQGGGRGGAPGGARFRVHVEDVRDGVLVFEDVSAAASYCSLLQREGHGSLGVAELEASEVFSVCADSRALAVVIRSGQALPTPSTLRQHLGRKSTSLED